MNIVYFMGRLGNQMFQYALYRSLECHNKMFGVSANIDWYSDRKVQCDFVLMKAFPNLRISIDNDGVFEKKKIFYLKWRKNREWIAFLNYHIPFLCMFFKEKEDYIYDKRVKKLKNAAIIGYWQSEKYFKDIRETILQDFTFSYGEDKLQVWKKKLLKDDRSVAIHIRRGDYKKHIEIYGNLSETQFYNLAIKFIGEKVQNPHLVFFSDEIAWVKTHYSYKDAVYISPDMFEHYEAWYDMCLMSCCSHNIIANSSFSWWGAWLNNREDKIVIAPKEWLIDKKTTDIWCDNWIVM